MVAANPFVTKMERMLDLTGDERTAVEQVQLRFATVAKDQYLVREGDRPTRCILVATGLLATSSVSGNGKRQITAFHIKNDIPDLLGLHLDVLDFDLRAVSISTVVYIEHSAIQHLCDRHPRIATALWRATLIDATTFREWCVNLGQRPAVGRLAHLFCEMMARTRSAGLAEGNSCALHVTQSDLAEATGLSDVHVNRSLQQLRGRGLIEFNGAKLTVPHWEALTAVADFDPQYLHLTSVAH